MSDFPLRLSVLITAFTVASGIFDSLAFTYAATIWQNGRLVWAQAAKSGVTFFLGIAMYWMAIRYLSEAGIVMPEIQTLLWFGVTIVGVAVLGGGFLSWQLVDQVVAVGVMVGIGFLISRSAA